MTVSLVIFLKEMSGCAREKKARLLEVEEVESGERELDNSSKKFVK